jgi:hypothetical protein
MRPVHQLQKLVYASQGGERSIDFVFAVQGLGGLLGAQCGAAVHLGAGWQLPVQPSGHALRLFFATGAQGSEHVVADQF